MAKYEPFKTGELVAPNYRGTQWGWPKDLEAEVTRGQEEGHHFMEVRFVTDEETFIFDGQAINAQRAFSVEPGQFKRVRVTKASVDAAIKSIMSAGT